MKIVIWIVVSMVVVLGALTLIGMRVAKNFDPNLLITAARIEKVQRGDLVELVSAPGQVQPKTKVSISARIAARIVELPFEEGQTVTKGKSVLVKLDATDLEAQLRATEARAAAQDGQLAEAAARISATEAQIAASQIMFEDAKRELGRQKKLLEPGDVSQSAVDQAQAKSDQLAKQIESSQRAIEADRQNLVVLKHQIDAAQAEIARAKDNLSYTTIVSPIDGVVTRINAKVGELVMTGTMNNPGTVIMEVADLSQMLVNAKVDETSVTSLKIGQPAAVRAQAYPGKVFKGKVHSVALSQTDETSGNSYYKTEILLDIGDQRIFSGLTADVEIETKRHEKVLKVPSQAVLGRTVDSLPTDIRSRPEVERRKTITAVVYRFMDGKAVVTPVKIGASDTSDTIIESGLSDSDTIVTGPYKILDKLEHDQKLRDERSTTQPTTAPVKS